MSEGERQEIVNLSEAQKLKQVNEAEGKAKEIELLAAATAEGFGQSLVPHERGGMEAVNLRVAEQYVEQFSLLKRRIPYIAPRGG